jgi:hypothetical protein
MKQLPWPHPTRTLARQVVAVDVGAASGRSHRDERHG